MMTARRYPWVLPMAPPRIPFIMATLAFVIPLTVILFPELLLMSMKLEPPPAAEVLPKPIEVIASWMPEPPLESRTNLP